LIMSDFSVSTRYARALWELAESEKSFEQVARDVDFTLNTFRDSKDLRNVITSPIISTEKKLKVIDTIFGDKISSTGLKFLKFIILKNREEVFGDILKRFAEIRDEEFGILRVEVTTAYDMPPEQKKELEAKLSDYSGKKIEAVYKKDENIIGGFLVKMKDTVIDASVKNQLEILRKSLREEKVNFNLN
jgi:F-type H+-transporting ATPase subunit delta